MFRTCNLLFLLLPHPCLNKGFPVSLTIVHKPVSKLFHLDSSVLHDLGFFSFRRIRMRNVVGTHDPGLEIFYCFVRQAGSLAWILGSAGRRCHRMISDYFGEYRSVAPIRARSTVRWAILVVTYILDDVGIHDWQWI